MFRTRLVETKDLLTGISTYVNSEFDALGRNTFTSQPSLSSVETKGTDTFYDGLGRVTSTKETVAPYAETKYRYLNNHRKRVTDPSGAWKDYYSYGYEGPDNEDYRAIYEYANGAYQRQTYMKKNVWGELDWVRQWGNQNGYDVNRYRYYYYNNKRQICRYREAEGGDSVYQYDAAGWLIAYQKGLPSNSTNCDTPTGTAKVSLIRDALDQVTTTDFADTGTADISTVYDAVGNVKELDRGTTSWTYDYDPDIDLLKSESLSVDGRMYGITYDYDNAGNLFSKTLPGGKLINFNPDGLGRAREARNGAYKYAYDMTYHPSGQVKSYKSRSGFTYNQTLNDRLLPERVWAHRVGVKAVDFTFGYDARGLVTTMNDDTGVFTNNNRSYSYDGLGQVVAASGPWGTGSFKYDSLGNIREKKLGGRTISLTYDSRNRVNKSTDTGGTTATGGNTGTRTIAYDNRGNVTTLGTIAFVYDHADQPITVSGGTNGSYVYDGNKKRVKSTVGGKTIYNVYDASGKLVHVDNVSDNKRTDYVSASGLSIARLQGNKATYLFSDHLGSPVAGVEWDSTQGWHVEWRERYTPFGISLENDPDNKDLAGFTGHIKDSATGLNYMQARYYDPVIGRFLSEDPETFTSQGMNPGYFNRYMYTMNNPINAVDPDGRACIKRAGSRICKRNYKRKIRSGRQAEKAETKHLRTKDNERIVSGRVSANYEKDDTYKRGREYDIISQTKDGHYNLTEVKFRKTKGKYSFKLGSLNGGKLAWRIYQGLVTAQQASFDLHAAGEDLTLTGKGIPGGEITLAPDQYTITWVLVNQHGKAIGANVNDGSGGIQEILDKFITPD